MKLNVCIKFGRDKEKKKKLEDRSKIEEQTHQVMDNHSYQHQWIFHMLSYDKGGKNEKIWTKGERTRT